MFSEDPLERHRRSRIFTGRIVELQCAAWLESLGWVINGVEAFRVGSDIEATKAGERATFEVKAFGRQDEAFVSVLKSLRGQSAVRWTSPAAAVNYLLFRAYESAKQLQVSECGRIAILVIEELSWRDFQRQLEGGWIDWANPSFLGHDPEWENFLNSQRSRYPQLRSELASVLQSLDAIWVAQRRDGFEYQQETVIVPCDRASR